MENGKLIIFFVFVCSIVLVLAVIRGRGLGGERTGIELEIPAEHPAPHQAIHNVL